MTTNPIAHRIAARLFTNSNGDTAKRLQLRGEGEKDLGGMCLDSALRDIAAELPRWTILEALQKPLAEGYYLCLHPNGRQEVMYWSKRMGQPGAGSFCTVKVGKRTTTMTATDDVVAWMPLPPVTMDGVSP